MGHCELTRALLECIFVYKIHAQMLGDLIIFPRNVSFREYYVFVSNAAAASVPGVLGSDVLG